MLKKRLNNRFHFKNKLQENVVIKPKSNFFNTKVMGKSKTPNKSSYFINHDTVMQHQFYITKRLAKFYLDRINFIL